MLILFKPKKKLYKRADNFQLLDLLQLSRKEKECQQSCKRSIRQFDDWKKRHREAHSQFPVYSQIEGILLRRQAQDAVLLYKIVRKDRMRAFADYIEKLPARKPILGVVS